MFKFSTKFRFAVIVLFVGSLSVAQPAPPINLRIANGPQGSGTGLAAPSSWSVTDEQAVTGDIIKVDIQSVPTETGYSVDHFEIGIQKPSGTTIERVLLGPATNYPRRHRGVTGRNKVWLRAVYKSETDRSVKRAGKWSQPIELNTTVGSPRVTITASKTNLIQGEGAYLEASVSGANTLRPLHELHFRWYVTKSGEQGSFDALPSYFATHFNNTRTEGYGSAWAFVPKTIGDTTVHLEVRNRSGVIATNSITLTTTALTTAFTPAQTYVVSAAGDFAGAPAASHQFTSVEAAFNAIVAANKRGSKGKAWLVLRAGESYDSATGLKRFVRDELEMFAITTFGSGQAPVVKLASSLAMNTAIIQGINFKGYYDPSDPMNMPGLGSGGINISGVKHSTISNSKFTGYATAINVGTTGAVSILHNIEVTDWGDYGIHQGDTGLISLVGSYLHQNPRTWRGRGKGEKEPPFLADHGPYRTSRPTANRVVSKVVAFSTNSWTSDRSIQPTFRFFGGGPSRPLRLVCSEIISEGGAFVISLNNKPLNSPSPQDIIIDKLIHLSTTQPLHAFSTSYGGTTVKNFMIITPNVPTEGSGSGTRATLTASDSGGEPGVQDNKNNPVVFVNGSVIDLRAGDATHDRTFGLFSGGKQPFNDVTVENIMVYAPQIPGGVTDTLPLDLSPNWTPEYIGRFSWSAGSPDFTYASPPESTALFKPQPGSSAYKSATGDYIPVDDIAGTLRSGSTSKGAFH